MNRRRISLFITYISVDIDHQMFWFDSVALDLPAQSSYISLYILLGLFLIPGQIYMQNVSKDKAVFFDNLY